MTVNHNNGKVRLSAWLRAHAGRIFVCLSAAALMFNASCERRPLYDPDNYVHIKVTVNTDSISNVTCHQYNPDITAPVIDPKMMRVLFYKSDGTAIESDTYISSVSEDAYGRPVIEGDVSVLPGDYKLLVYNFDTESTQIRDDRDYTSIEAYTNVVNSAITKRFASKSDDDEISNSIYYEPDHLMVAREEATSIPYHEGTYTLYETAYTVVQTYYLQIKVHNIQYVSSAQAILSGLSSGNLIGNDTQVVDPEAIVYFTLQKSTDGGDDVIACIFNTFGKIEEVNNQLAVTFNVYTSYGTTKQLTIDITDVFHTPEAIEKHWLLIEDTIDIPEPQNTNSNSGGWSPGVSEWETENHDISI